MCNIRKHGLLHGLLMGMYRLICTIKCHKMVKLSYIMGLLALLIIHCTEGKNYCTNTISGNTAQAGSWEERWSRAGKQAYQAETR